MKYKTLLIVLLALSNASYATASSVSSKQAIWNQSEIATLRYLWINSLASLPRDPSNRFADEPKAAILGKKLFFDPRFSAQGNISCASCHQPKLSFTDGKALSKGTGKTKRNSPTLVGIAYSPWFFWDGRADSQWAQALGPLENGVEHGGNRTQYAHVIANNTEYLSLYQAIFGPFPDISDSARFPHTAGPVSDPVANNNWKQMAGADKKTITRIFVNMGKSLAAFERTILPVWSRFDYYVKAILDGDAEKSKALLNNKEIAGLRLFIGKATCVICHTGPLFTNHDFKNIAVPLVKQIGKDQGRFDGVQIVMKSEFNCLSEYSDAKIDDCKELRFIKFTVDDTLAAFKIPSLRNVARTAPYMHSGQFKTLKEVLKHYQKRPRARLGHSDLIPFHITDKEVEQLEAFLLTLNDAPEPASLNTASKD